MRLVWFLSLLALARVALAQSGPPPVVTTTLPGLSGRTGLTTIVLDTSGGYTIPARCTGPALVDLLATLLPHLETGKKTAPIPTLLAPLNAAALRTLADAIDQRDQLMTRYKALLTACQKGE